MRKKTKISKSYENIEFLNSPGARPLRLLAELVEPQQRLRREGVKDTIVFFGSARIKPAACSKKRLMELLKSSVRLKKRNGYKKMLENARIDLEMSRYYEDAVKLSKRITEWTRNLKEPYRFVICSGGGPGIMEAANKGSFKAKGRSLGLNISLPMEQNPNPYITKELNLEFHYFFMRKFWFVYLAKAFVMFPGGFGTMDELMEVLTLVQTQKLRKKVIILLYGKSFWNKVLNFEALIRYRLISPGDLKLFRIVDSPQEAFESLKNSLIKYYPLETA
jgi:uncharacterized protein (TIGR00730 family)